MKRLKYSSVVASQVDLHAEYGGVVPEIASREHVKSILPVIDRALKEADLTLKDLDGLAVTYGPGLVGALLVGVAAAKGLAAASGLPLIPVHHLEGHIASAYLAMPIWSRFPTTPIFLSWPGPGMMPRGRPLTRLPGP